MTIIAWDGKALAGDRATWCGSHAQRTVKVFRLDLHRLPFTRHPILIGFAGSASFAAEVLAWLRGEKGEAPTPPPSMDEKACALVIDRRRRAWRLPARSLTAPEVLLDRRLAYGAEPAMGVAIGAMTFGATAKQAVQLAIARTDCAALGVDVVTF